MRLGLIAGDGIGPEVTREALKAIEAARVAHELVEFDLGAERYLRTGEVISEAEIEAMRDTDAVLLGAVGDPRVKPGILERELLLRLRFDLDLYVNLRPVKLPEGVESPLSDRGPKDIDMVVVRENSESVYAGAGGVLARGTPREVATQDSINTRSGVDRVLRYAFEVASRRERRNLTLVHKTNVLTHAGDLWMRAFTEMGETQFPEVSRDYLHVDAACMFMVTQPDRFDVVVTENMFGDILTDIGAGIAGGIGLAASGNINPDPAATSIFEPVHGSAPDIAGTGRANPVAAILSAAMMLEDFGRSDEARVIEGAALQVLTEIAGSSPSTSEIGDRVAALVASR
ncbi:MAG: 3-isopropylmalate dehydrogenase [Actinomycetota bacterium]